MGIAFTKEGIIQILSAYCAEWMGIKWLNSYLKDREIYVKANTLYDLDKRLLFRDKKDKLSLLYYARDKGIL